jgi:hypothetical protein
MKHDHTCLIDGRPAGSLPPLKRLLSITGPQDLRAVLAAQQKVSLPPAYLLNLAKLTDEQLVTALWGTLWIMRGRMGLLQDGTVDDGNCRPR